MTYERAMKEGVTMEDFTPTREFTLDFKAATYLLYESLFKQYSGNDRLSELMQLKMVGIKHEVRSRVERRCSQFEIEWRQSKGFTR